MPSYRLWTQLLDLAIMPPGCMLAILAYCSIASSMTLPFSQTLALPNINLATNSSFGLQLGTAPLQVSPVAAEPLSWGFGSGGSLLASIINAEVSAPEVWKSECSAALYGHVMMGSCRKAFEDIPQYNGMQSFGNRGTGKYDVVLPLRFIGLDGKCVIDIEIRDPRASERTTGREVAVAARDVIGHCVLGPQGIGGTIRGIGRNHRMSVTLQEYKPDVTCSPPATGNAPADLSTCQHVLNSMPAAKWPQIFGARGTPNSISMPGIDIPLPITYADEDFECAITVSIEGKPVETEWHDVWGVAIAVVGICVADQKDGTGLLNVGASTIRVGIENKNATSKASASAASMLPQPSTGPVATT